MDIKQAISYLDMSAFWNFIKFNVEIARIIWIDATIILSEVYNEYKFFLENNQLEDGWFFLMVEKLEQKTTLSRYQQNKAMTELQDRWLLEFKNKWIPPKRRIKLNLDEMIWQFWPQRSKNLTYIDKQEWKEITYQKFDDYIKIEDIKDIPTKRELLYWPLLVNTEVVGEVEFEQFWAVYPKHSGKKKAKEAFKKALKKTTADIIIAKAKEYADEVKKKWTEDKYIKWAQGWLNDERYLDWEQPKKLYNINSITEDMLTRDWKAKWASIKWIENLDLRVQRMKKFVEEVNQGMWLKK